MSLAGGTLLALSQIPCTVVLLASVNCFSFQDDNYTALSDLLEVLIVYTDAKFVFKQPK